jgi:hypothetical protein
METTPGVLPESAIAAVLFACAFLFGDRFRPLKWLGADRRALISFGAGMSAAYVFVHLMPELDGAREAFAESLSDIVRYEGMAIYLFALLGFIVFYGLETWRTRLRELPRAERTMNELKLHVIGFVGYVSLMGYLSAHGLEETRSSTALFTIAIVFHLLGVDHEFRREHGAAYTLNTRFVLAGAAIVGWVIALVIELPRAVIASLLAFVSGAVIMNSMVMELPSEKEGRFLPFLAGAGVYGILLVPLG